MKNNSMCLSPGHILILIGKTPLGTKLIWMLLSLFISIVPASAQKVSIHLDQAKVIKVLATITEQTGLSVAYSKQIVNLEREVDIHATDADVTVVLNQLVTGTRLDYEIKNGKIYLFEKKNTSAAPQQKKKIHGKISDQAGEAIIGANVVEKGTANGVITNMDGEFELEVDDNAILQISYIGYVTQEHHVKEKSILNIILREDTEILDEVVVVGYGTQKKVNLTGSISTVKFDEEMSNRPITDASQALSGKVPGVWISQNSGQPGNDGAQLRIRGWGTMNDSNPLVIIDGIEGSFSQINPNDIESITVLKDAASAAIYGSKAANGVVLVTTKMGKKNERTQVELNSYVGVQQLGRRFKLINNSAEMMDMVNQALENSGENALFSDGLIEDFATGTDPYKYPNTDWYDYLYHNALITGHNLSIRGGSDKLSTFVSLNYLNQEGILRETKAEKYGIRANLEFNVNSWLKVGARLNYNRKISREPFDLSRVLNQLSGAAPFIAPYTRDGSYGSVQAINDDGTLLYALYNPVIDANNGEKKTTYDYLSLNAFAMVNFTKDLNLQVNWSSNGVWIMEDKYNETLYGCTDTGVESMPKNYNIDGIIVRRSQESRMRNIFHATLNYGKTFGARHDIGAIVGMQIENYNVRNVMARRTNPPKEGLTQVDSGTDGIKGEGNLSRLRMGSYFGRINYAFDGKYLFEANLRADASSRFRRGNRWGVFPGFSAGWRLGEEAFIKNLNVFSNLKLRASWGQLGNQNLSGYWPYLTLITSGFGPSYNLGGSVASGAAVTTLVDEDISWETTSSLDIGLDMGFFSNRLNVEVDYFDKNTKDIIVQLPISNVLGNKTAPYENVGKMNNKGFEFTVNYDNLETDENKLGFNVGLNFTYVTNKVTKFQGGNSPDQLYLIREGYSYKSIYGYKAIGIYQTDEDAAEHMRNNGFKPEKGNIKYEDVNNDGKLDYQDQQVLGNTIPKITYGITAGLRYKRFDLNLLFQGLGQANAMTKSDMTRLRYEWLTITESWRDAWTPENSQSQIPMLRFDSSWDTYDSSFWMHRIDFLKLKNIQLGYLFPDKLTRKLGLQKIYLYANAQNVFTIMWKKGYEGYDPERDTFGSGVGLYPTPRIFTFGINLNF